MARLEAERPATAGPAAGRPEDQARDQCQPQERDQDPDAVHFRDLGENVLQEIFK